jgi:nucleoside phosphorylase
MSKSNAFETALLGLLFENTAITNLGDAGGLRATATPGDLFFSLHTANPDEAGNQTTSEVAYTSYARVAVARSAAGWTVTGDAVALDADVVFPAGTGGSGTATHWGLGTLVSGAGVLLYYGAISPSIVCGNGVTPRLTAGTVVTEA